MGIQSYFNKIIDFFNFESSENPGNDNLNEIMMKTKNSKKIINIHQNKDIKIILYNPKSFDEVKNIVDDLKSYRGVIINLKDINFELARRILDFISGAIYSIDGSIKKVGDAVFLLTPVNIEINGVILEEKIDDSFY
jgi:cell division inhibitor SepF